MADSAEPSSPSSKRPAPRRKRHWLWRTLFALLILLVVLVVVVQVVLRGDTPRRVVVAQVQNALGVRMTARSVDTGWFGRTTLRDVTLSLPLADESFVRVERMEVSHTSLPVMLVTRGLDVKAVALHRPHLLVRQDAAGQWNLQEVADLLARTGGSKEAGDAPDERRASIDLPRLLVKDATLEVIDNAGRRALVSPVFVSGQPDGARAWKYEAKAPADVPDPRVSITGRLAPGGAWQHEVSFAIHDMGPWVEPWLKDWPRPDRVSGQWSGRIDQGGVIGRLQVERADVGPVGASGVLTARAGDGAVTLHPEGVLVRASHPAAPG
ncbi:MAG: hypothetical protein ACREIT_06175, partial [Tepidisphaeraceae bacterium]